MHNSTSKERLSQKKEEKKHQQSEVTAKILVTGTARHENFLLLIK